MTKVAYPSFKDFLNEITLNTKEIYHNSWKDKMNNSLSLSITKDETRKILVVHIDAYDKDKVDVNDIKDSEAKRLIMRRCIDLISDFLVRGKYLNSEYHLAHKMPNDFLTQIFNHIKINLKLKNLAYYQKHFGLVFLPLEK